MNKSRLARIAGSKALVNRIVEEVDAGKPLGLSTEAYVKSHLDDFANQQACTQEESFNTQDWGSILALTWLM